MAMTKAHLVESVGRALGIPKKDAAELVDRVFELLRHHLEQGENLKISGFGNFIVREKKPRMGRNPRTKEPMPISARRVVSFRPSPILKAELNPNRAPAAAVSAPAKAAKSPKPKAAKAPKGS